MIIDFHNHIYPEELAEKVISNLESNYKVRREHNATLSSLLASLEKGKIDKAIVLPIATEPEHTEYNQWYALLKKTSPKIIPFGSIHPENDIKELEAFPTLGLKGLKIQPNALQIYPSDKRMMKFYKKAEELGLIIFFHAGDEKVTTRRDYFQPASLLEVLKKYPRLKIILSHIKRLPTWEELDSVINYPNVYFDTAEMAAHTDDNLFFLSLVDKIGIDKIIFGSDFPFTDHQAELKRLQKLLGKKDASKIFSTNPVKLLEL